MFKLGKKKLAYPLSALLFIFLVFVLIPALGTPVVKIVQYPAFLVDQIRREIGGMIFYHRNFIENERLKLEVDSLKGRLSRLAELDRENQRLTELLSLKQASQFKLTAARVIARSPDNWNSIVIINKGKKSGIKRGLAVITPFGLVGRIVEAGNSVSKVMLIRDTGLGVSAMVERSRQEGLVTGTLDNFLMMKYLPKDADIKISDTVITSGLTESYPKGVLIGSVIEIGDEFGGLSRYALIKPAVNLSSVEEVMVVLP